MKMTVFDFAKKASLDSDEIPVEVRDKDGNLIEKGKSLWYYAAHGGLALSMPIHAITICRDVIIIRVK